MALYLPQALTINSLNGGYRGDLDFTQLSDTQTNNAQNTVITPITIKQRNGYTRMLNTALTKGGVRTDTGLNGQAVKGHYQLKKSIGDVDTKKHCVAAGEHLWEYSSACASIIMNGLTNKEDAIWSFVQIQDPRDGSDDIVVGVNGYDYPVVWNGTEDSAIFLNDISGASGVMPAKYAVSLKNRICLMNINDPSDVDSKSKILLSELSPLGVPSPHVFPAGLSFYVGGSDKFGGITGGAALNGRILIFKNNTIYTFEFGGGALDEAALQTVHEFSLQQINENIGCVAPRTIVSTGDMVLFLSDAGVYAYGGGQLVYMSKAIEEDLKNINFARKKYASAGYNRAKNQYWLAVSSTGKDYNDTVFVFDFEDKVWYAPYTGMKCDLISNFIEGSQEKLLSADKLGYIYKLDKGMNDGKEIGYNLVPSSLTGGDTVNFYDSQSIYAEGDGLLGLSVRALGATGANALPRLITDSTGTQITVEPAWGSDVDSGTTICLLGIDSYLNTKDYDLGSPDISKMYRRVSPRIKRLGNINLNMNYIIDFNDLSEAATATINQYDNSLLCFTGGDFATGTQARYSGTIETVSVGTSSISVSAGTDLSASNLIGYGMYLWNSGTRYVRPIATGECETIGLGLYGTQSEVAVNTATTYLINTNLENTWGTAKWGPGKPHKTDVSLRSLYTQQHVGDHISLRFGNNRANETWEIYGFDMLAKAVGRR